MLYCGQLGDFSTEANAAAKKSRRANGRFRIDDGPTTALR